MRIGWIGGLDRSRALLERVAEEEGHVLEAHTGDVSGRGSHELEGLVERSDIVVVLTELNSHGAMYRAKDLAREKGRPFLALRRGSVSGLRKVMGALRQRAA